MENEKRIPRVRILEKDFPSKIPRDIKDSFLEVVNEEGATIALFFLYESFHKTDFVGGRDFALYYDSLDIEDYGFLEDDDLKEMMEFFDVSDLEELLDHEFLFEEKHERNSDFGDFSWGLIIYGRLKYPFELDEDSRIKYSELFLSAMIYNGKLFYEFGAGMGYPEWAIARGWEDDWVDIVNFSLNFFGADEIIPENFIYKSQVHVKDYEFFLNLDAGIFRQIAENLLTRDNIGSFIETASEQQKTELVAFLLDYQNQHLKDDKSSLQLE